MIIPSDSDLALCPDSVREYVGYLEDELFKEEQEKQKYKGVYTALDNACLFWQFPCSLINPDASINELLDITDKVARDTEINKDAAKFGLEQQKQTIEDILEIDPITLIDEEGFTFWAIDLSDILAFEQEIINEIKQINKV